MLACKLQLPSFHLHETLLKYAKDLLKCRAGLVDVFKSSNRKANLPVLWLILLLEIHAVILGVAGLILGHDNGCTFTIRTTKSGWPLANVAAAGVGGPF